MVDKSKDVPVRSDSPRNDSLQSRVNQAVKLVMEAERNLRNARAAERRARAHLAEAESGELEL